MSGIPAPLLKELRETLVECGPFYSHRVLRTIFDDTRLKPWKNRIPEADDVEERVNLFVSKFHNTRNNAGQNVLIIFLQVLHELEEEADECQRLLTDLAIKAAYAFNQELPPMARNNLWRASAVSAGDVLSDGLASFQLPPFDSIAGGLTEPLPAGLSSKVFAESLESLKNEAKADWLSIEFLERGLAATRAVGRVEETKRGIGTAFLVAPNLVLTNAHVVRDLSELTKGGVRFNEGKNGPGQVHYFTEQVASSSVEDLDFALVRLDRPAESPHLALSDERIDENQPANILQFPQRAGKFMQVALRHNTIVHVGEERLYYATDTERGSSGSPVFNDNWQVIGLHRAGMVDDRNRPVPNANQGVPMTAIEPHIRQFLL